MQLKQNRLEKQIKKRPKKGRGRNFNERQGYSMKRENTGFMMSRY
jgi:hypothetical protein